jgi:molecular chaperone GrpE
MSAKKKTSRDASKDAGAAEDLKKTQDAEDREEDDNSINVKVMPGGDAQPDDQIDNGGESAAPESEIEKLTREKDEQHDRLLRAQAEFDNYRKRMQKERAELLKYGAENALREILPVIDNLELAVGSARSHDNSDAQLLEGIEMIQSQFASILERMGLRPVETVDHPFDPNKHDALLRVHAPDSDDGTVVAEIRKGYYLHDKILRAAQVTVGTHEDEPASKDGVENSES